MRKRKHNEHNEIETSSGHYVAPPFRQTGMPLARDQYWAIRVGQNQKAFEGQSLTSDLEFIKCEFEAVEKERIARKEEFAAYKADMQKKVKSLEHRNNVLTYFLHCCLKQEKAEPLERNNVEKSECEIKKLQEKNSLLENRNIFIERDNKELEKRWLEHKNSHDCKSLSNKPSGDDLSRCEDLLSESISALEKHLQKPSSEEQENMQDVGIALTI